MDTPNLEQPVRQLVTDGEGKFFERDYLVPMLLADEIRVEAIMTGVCRSDIDMMKGNFGPLPLEMQGHEGLGEVVKVGKEVTDANVGDIVATRGEPGFADYYNAKMGTFVKVPKVDPKYILEPVACGINVANAVYNHSEDKEQTIAIIGTGFLARVTHYTLKRAGYKNFYVYGKAYPEYWDNQDVTQINHTGFHLQMPTGVTGFDAFIDFSSKAQYITSNYVNENGIFVMAAEKKVDNLDFSKYLWDNITIKCPSPRDPSFIDSMRYARECIKSNSLKVSDMWEMGYDRDEWLILRDKMLEYMESLSFLS